MSETNRSRNLGYQGIDLSWMVGRVVTEVTFHEWESWHFLLEAKLCIVVECPWRIIRNGRIALSNSDHGQKFGLPAHIDAAVAATELLSAVSITGVQLREGVTDLLIDFVDGLRLEVIPLSSGYESWQWSDPAGDSFYVQGGGNIVRFPRVPRDGQ